MTMENNLINALRKGKELTAVQIANQFGFANPYAAIGNLRYRHGLAVYSNRRKNNLTKYRLGNPTKNVVIAGQRAVNNLNRKRA